DDHRMGSNYINNDISSELGQIVSTDNRVNWTVLMLPYLVGPGFVLEQFRNLLPIFQSPLHMRDKSSEWEALLLCPLHYSFKQFESSMLIEVTVQQMVSDQVRN